MKLCAAYVDDNCKWYVGAFMKAKFNGLWMVTSYVGPHSCIPFSQQRDGKMMDSNFVASKFVENCDKITLLVLMSSGRSYILSIIMSFLTIKYEMQNKRQLLRYLGIGRSLTKGCESCCWHTWIRTQVPSTTITPYLGHTKVLHYCAMYIGHSLHALLHSNIAGQ